MKKKQLQVAIEVREPSVVDLTVGEHVQLDCVVPGRRGRIAQRHGDLLRPGTTTLALPPGFYSFKTLSASSLRVVSGGVQAVPMIHTKGDPPDPPAVIVIASGAGDEPEGEPPAFVMS